MENKQKKNRKPLIITLSVVAVLLVVAIILGVFAIIAHINKSPIIFECEGQKIDTAFYEFMLSRVKGDLYKGNYDVNSDSFWNTKIEGADITYEQFYNQKILNECKTYLAALVLFDQLVADGDIAGLPQDYYDEIDEQIQLYIDLGYIGNGSRDKLDELLSDYSVDTDTLREIYIAEAKVQYVREYLYGGAEASKIGDNVKEEYYKENYYRFKHILVGNFYYEYVRDEFGNVIYYNGEGGYALYDYNKGEKRDDDGDGMYNKDADGETIAYDKETGEYLYDTENGVTRFVTDSDGQIKKFYYTKEQMADRLQIANQLCDIEKSDFETFEKKGADSSVNTDYSNTFETSSGIYMSDIEKAAYNDYMLKMLDAVKTMAVGDIAMIEAEDGYHVIMKYELNEGAYAENNSKKWFQSFNSSLINKLFLDKCEGLFAKIQINEANLDRAKSIKDIGINTDY